MIFKKDFLPYVILAAGLLLFLGLPGCKPAPVVKPEALPPEPAEPQVKQSSPDPQALKHFMDGQMYMNQGDYALAILEFQEALERDPDAGTIYVSMAECYWNLGKPDRAEKQLKKALEIDPEDMEALEMLGNEYILRKRYTEAETVFLSLTQLDSTKTNYLVTLGELAKIRKDFHTAIQYYRKAFSVDPSRIDYLETAGQFALHVQDYSLALEIFQQLVSLEPEHLPYVSTYVELILDQKQYQQGIEFFESLNRQYGTSADRMAQIGLLAYQAGQRGKAFQSVKRAVAIEPSNPDYFSTLMDLYLNDEALDTVEVLADSFIVAYPEDPRGYVNRALVAFNRRNHSAVVSILSPIADDFSGNFTIHYLLGLSFNQLKQYDQAENFLKQSEAIRPDSRQVKHSLALLYDTTERWSLSDSLFQALIRSDSSDAQALNNYAYSLAERGLDLERAFAYAKRAVELEPDNSAYLDTMGWIYYKLNKIPEALEYLKHSVELDNSNPVVLEHYGDVLMKSQQKEAAKTVYQQALKLDSENERLKEKAKTE